MTKKKAGASSSVKSHQRDINAEKQKMDAYTKKMGTSVRSLQGEFKKCAKEMKDAGRTMITEGNKNMHAKVGKFKAMIAESNKNMHAKVGKFKGEIKDQIKENKAAVAHMENGVQFFVGEANKKKKDFQAYIKSFWG